MHYWSEYETLAYNYIKNCIFFAEEENLRYKDSYDFILNVGITRYYKDADGIARNCTIGILGLIVTFPFCRDNRISTKGQVFWKAKSNWQEREGPICSPLNLI